MQAAPLDVSGVMLQTLSRVGYPHPWYMLALFKSFEAYRPIAFQDIFPGTFTDHVEAAFAPTFASFNGTDKMRELNALWSNGTNGTLRPLDALVPELANSFADPASAPYARLAAQLAAHSDLHVGWKPVASIQHLCTGADDDQVPPLDCTRTL